MGCEADSASACNFALVSYIHGRLAGFLDGLRAELKPGCTLRAHVTVLPPRPVDLNVDDSIRHLVAECREVPPFRVTLGAVSVFEKSNVVYLALTRGADELRELNADLDCDAMEYCCKFPFHPHITLAQDLTPEQAASLADIARKRWAAYDGPREFVVEELAFVRSCKPGEWEDLAAVELAQPVSAR